MDETSYFYDPDNPASIVHGGSAAPPHATQRGGVSMAFRQTLPAAQERPWQQNVPMTPQRWQVRI